MTEENDFDKKFKEDLERAQALSLESLALEKFRLQKLEEEKKKGIYLLIFLIISHSNYSSVNRKLTCIFREKNYHSR